MGVPILYGTFNLNDGINYFVTGRDDLSFPSVKQTYFKIARLEGVKKTGESVDQKQITISMLVLGTSRADLELKIDALYQALNLRSQYLSLHSSDGRQYVADCTDASFPLKEGNILYATGQAVFTVLVPYASASNTSVFTTGNVSLASVSGSTYTFSTISITGGGNVYTRPIIHFDNNDGTIWTQVQIQQTTDSQILTITGALPGNSNDYLDVYCDPTGFNGYTALLNGNTLATVQGVFPVIEPIATNFLITISATSAPTAVALTFTWNSRYLS